MVSGEGHHQLENIFSELNLVVKKSTNKLKNLLMLPLMGFLSIEFNLGEFLEISPPSAVMSLKEVCSLYPRRIKKLFTCLDLDLPGLERVKVEVDKEDWVLACEALIYYYSNVKNAPHLHPNLLEIPPAIDFCAESILENTFTFQNITSKVLSARNGSLNWSYKGEKNDREWAWFLNRHHHILYLFELYQKNGKSDYIKYINNHLFDWIISSFSKKNCHNWAQWRGLETGYRLVNWASIFYELQQLDEFTPATRILMLSSILDHVYYLRHIHAWGANWLTREMNGLATAALFWPEFKNSQKWLNYASEKMFSTINEQVYPDGVHKELTSHYHWITIRDFQKFFNLLDSSGKSIPVCFKNRLEKMWNYLAYSMRPNGYGLLNNDSDLGYNLPLVRAFIDLYKRPDWEYITTHGELGEKVSGAPSTIFPWAGHVIMRSSWDKNAHWAFFDVGPLGINYHVHKDKLHLSIAAYGRDLLVDSGRYSYVRDKFWPYFRDSASHNVILIDGKGQKGDVKEWRKPMAGNYTIAPEFDFATGTFDAGYIDLKGKATHSRTVVYLRGKYWIVVDRITTDRPRQIQALWHFHPDCTVIVEDKSVASIDPNAGNLRIMPASDLNWQVKIVAGEENPIQGWWSGEYNQILPNPTAIYETEILATTNFVWVIFPSQGIPPSMKAEMLPSPPGAVKLNVEISGQKLDEIAIPMIGDRANNSEITVEF